MKISIFSHDFLINDFLLIVTSAYESDLKFRKI